MTGSSRNWHSLSREPCGESPVSVVALTPPLGAKWLGVKWLGVKWLGVK